MEEIKFRAWWPGVKKMKYFVQGYFEHIKEIGWAMTFVQTGESKSIYLGVAEVMKFIGLKDRLGKDIYSGDIVKHAGWICEVKYGVNGCCYSLIEVATGNTDLQVITQASCNHIEVLGNIYENPELLKPKEPKDVD